MRYTILITFLLPATLFGSDSNSIYKKFRGEPISVLNCPSLSNLPAHTADDDPLADAAEAIRKHIDPTKSSRWKRDGYYKKDYKETILENYDSYNEFWKRIPLSSRRLVDIDNDGEMEYLVTSKGMQQLAWGFYEFFAILKKKNFKDHKLWELEFLYVLDNEEWLQDDDFQIVVTDADRDGRADILLETITIGGSGSCRTLHLISLPSSMKYSHHTLGSSYSVDVLYPDQLRPVFIGWDYDSWRSDDSGASARVRGPRRSYYHWSCDKGFLQM